MHPDRASRVPWPEVLFWALLLVHLIPFLAYRWFPTLDGPCHLYNARVILDLLRGDGPTMHFFELEVFPEPNWSGHALMAAAQAIGPAHLAEKLVILAFAIGLPLSFRFCLRKHPYHDPYLVLLIFPFILSYPLRMGFFNFCLGLPLMFLTIGVWRSFLTGDRIRIWTLPALLLLLYFSHLIAALVTLAILASMAIAAPSRSPARSRASSLRTLALSASPVLLLSLLFFVLHHDAQRPASRFPAGQILDWLFNGRPFVSLSDDEVPYARVMAIAMLVAALLVLLIRPPWVRADRSNPIWWLAAGAALVAAFALPDAMASGKFLTPRLLLFTMLFLCVALATCRMPRCLAIPLVVVVTTADLAVLPEHHERTASLARDVEAFLASTERCPDRSVLLPLNYSDNWMHSNLACYLGAVKGPVVLDNYEAATPHMPVRWREGMAPYDRLGDFHSSNRPCVDLDAFRAYVPGFTRLITTWRMPTDPDDSCAVAIRVALHREGEPIGMSSAAALYQLR